MTVLLFSAALGAALLSPLLRIPRAHAGLRSVQCKADAEADGPYRSSVLLPQTAFSQRANAVTREPELQRFWEEQRVYKQLCGGV